MVAPVPIILVFYSNGGTGATDNGGTSANYFGIFIVTVAPVPPIMAAPVPQFLINYLVEPLTWHWGQLKSPKP